MITQLNNANMATHLKIEANVNSKKKGKERSH